MPFNRPEASPASRRWVLLGIILVVIALQAMPFTEGYRRSADEIAFFDASTQGWRALVKLSEALAEGQGRLGLWFTIPLNALGAHFADIPAVRWLFVLLHFAVLALFAFYFSLISASRVTAALLLLLVVLQPLCRDNEFMPPVTYPLQNSLPFLCLLLARCVVVGESRRQDGGRASWLWPAYTVFALAMVTTEFAFLLGTSLLFAEYCFALEAWRGLPLGDRVRRLIGRRTVWLDALSVGSVLVAYFTYRLIHPSSYEGNVLDGAFEIGRVLATTFRHVWAGMTFSHDLIPPLTTPWGVWAAAAAVGIGTSWGLALSLPTIRSLPSPLLVAAGALVTILYVSFPLAANARQQRWCLVDGACGYLDSRLSYLAAVVVVLCVLAGVLREVTRPMPARMLVGTAALVLGAIAALTFIDSWQRGRTMRGDTVVWHNAGLLACYPDRQPASDDLLLRMIDGERRVLFHPGTDRAAYWRRYLGHAAQSRDCNVASEKASSRLAEVSKLGPVIAPGQTIDFTARTGLATYLGPGWTRPGPGFGVWSDGPRADVVLVPRNVPADRQAFLKLRFHPYFGPSVTSQTIDVRVNGVPTETWTLTMERDRVGCCERTIALPRAPATDGSVIVSFHFSRPRTPSLEPGSPETRRLAIALVAVTLTESRSP